MSRATPSDREVADRFIETFYRQNRLVDAFREWVHPDYVQHDPNSGTGRDATIEALEAHMQRSPDMDLLNRACPALDGRDDALLNWVSESGVVALCADNYAVEHYPAREQQGQRPALPLHEHCLFKLGIHLGELWYLTELAGWLRQNGRSRFLLTAPPLRLPGAAGSPVTPVATV